MAAVRNSLKWQDEGRFRFEGIFDYITKGVYPEGLEKPEKLSLGKRTKYFVVQEAQLYYIGGGEERISHSKSFNNSSEQGYSLSGYTINDNEIQFLPKKFHVVIHIILLVANKGISSRRRRREGIQSNLLNTLVLFLVTFHISLSTLPTTEVACPPRYALANNEPEYELISSIIDPIDYVVYGSMDE